MRIISGIARGTKLYTLDGINTRPTLDRVKEPLFNILNFRLQDAIVLDLFAGSGALGLESISRGAAKAIFCEHDRNAANIVQRNIEKTKFEQKSLLIRNDFEVALKQLKQDDVKLDIIFLDPPYKTNLIVKSLLKISDLRLLNDDGIIVLETDEPERVQEEIKDLSIKAFDIRKYGRVSLIFLQ